MSITIKSLQKPETKRALKRADLFNEQRRSKDILKTMDEDTYEEMERSGDGSEVNPESWTQLKGSR